jgi:hypothetical protein
VLLAVKEPTQVCPQCGRKFLAAQPRPCAICQPPVPGASLLPLRTCGFAGCQELVGEPLKFCMAHVRLFFHLDPGERPVTATIKRKTVREPEGEKKLLSRPLTPDEENAATRKRKRKPGEPWGITAASPYESLLVPLPGRPPSAWIMAGSLDDGRWVWGAETAQGAETSQNGRRDSQRLLLNPVVREGEALYQAPDLFCGAGGTTTGAEASGFVKVKLAVNHWRPAVYSHQQNHPHVRHVCAEIDQINPRDFEGIGIDLLMASPECVFHSLARGGRPVDDQRRASAAPSEEPPDVPRNFAGGRSHQATKPRSKPR